MRKRTKETISKEPLRRAVSRGSSSLLAADSNIFYLVVTSASEPARACDNDDERGM